jgi:hypothetical protein
MAAKESPAAQRLRIERELEESRARAGWIGRGIGALLFCVGLVLTYTVYEGMSRRAVYSAELLFMASWGMAGGAVMMALGVGGFARVRDVPKTMWAAYAGISAVLALIGFVPLGRVLARMAGFDGL